MGSVSYFVAEMRASHLQLQRAPPIRITTTFSPTHLLPTPGLPLGTSYTLTFPLNMAGVVQLNNIVAPPGWNISLTFAGKVYKW